VAGGFPPRARMSVRYGILCGMSLPPPPQDPQGHGAPGPSGSPAGPGAGSGGPPAGGFGPPQGFGPPAPPPSSGAPQPGPAQAGPPPPQGGFGPPPGSGQPAPGGFGPAAYGPPHGHPGVPGHPPYDMPPRPPGGGNGGAKVAAIVVGAVLVAAVAVGGVVLWVGGDGRKSTAEAGSESSPGAGREPDAGSTGEPDEAGDAEEPAPSAPSDDLDSGSSASPPENLVPYVVLKPGECFDHPSLSSDVRRVETRSCEEPHNGEVIANQTLTGSFEDEAALQAKVMKLCKADVDKRVQSIGDGRQYYFYAIYPSLATYNMRGDDTISCSVTLTDSLDGPKLDAPLPD
jgi:hypothetical protein